MVATESRFLALSPVGAGFLTGKIDEIMTFGQTDFRNAVPRFTPEAALKMTGRQRSSS